MKGRLLFAATIEEKVDKTKGEEQGVAIVNFLLAEIKVYSRSQAPKQLRAEDDFQIEKEKGLQLN